MELQLALSLSSSSSSSSSSSHFDLNDYNHETVHEKSMFGFMKTKDIMKRKVCVNGEEYDEEEEEEINAPKTLPLLFCNNTNQDCGDDVNEVVSSALMFIDHKHGGDENEVIGWPPVKSCRKKFCHRKNDGGDGGGSKSKSMFVKVQMEGDGIARKIDLNLHNSYHTLIRTLAHMFGKCKEDVKLTYQDQEGDWLLAMDLPWGSFIEAVQRLKLVRSSY